ncbi:MAG: hypothetical protein FJZ38_05135 [Candidatus Rokubacteria bacterium]|nr:hypothetical protein [Candidatus Rokubacteria bacterium]
MSRVRLFLVLILTIALDFSSPLPAPHAAETVEELEEAAHRHRGTRRAPHVRREAVTPAGARDLAVAARPRLQRPVARRRPAFADVVVRKQPPRITDSASAPEAH